jgi:hypothetical protein
VLLLLQVQQPEQAVQRLLDLASVRETHQTVLQRLLQAWVMQESQGLVQQAQTSSELVLLAQALPE